jgi:hypothetical protein
MNITKPRLDQFKITGSTVGDVYFPKVAALLPFDGTNGATSTSDLSNRSGGVSFAGTAQISTAQSKFGGSSLLLDGNSDYLTISDSYWASAMDSGDWTVEFWVRFAALGSNEELVGNRGNTGGNSSNGWALRKTTSNNIILYWYEGGQFNYLNNSQGSQTTLSADTWYHVAVTRSGNVWRLFLNGTQEDTVTDSGTIVSSNENRLFIGNFGTNYLNGYMDDLRITVGQARYTSNFTAPTSAHLTSAGDVNKHIVVNSDADGVAIGTGGINQARIAKAWVNFNGTSTVAIRSSYNVSSITDNGTGDYTANLSTALSDTNGAAVAMTGYVDHTWGMPMFKDVSGSNPLTTTQFRVATVEPETTSVTYYDQEQVSILIFGN